MAARVAGGWETGGGGQGGDPARKPGPPLEARCLNNASLDL